MSLKLSYVGYVKRKKFVDLGVSTNGSMMPIITGILSADNKKVSSVVKASFLRVPDVFKNKSISK
jgi:hypothetical protein